MEKNLTFISYSDNFANNLSSYAFAKIIEQETGERFYYENAPLKREKFENLMSCFNMDLNYISTNRVNQVTKKALELNKICLNKKNNKKNKYINLSNFVPNDIDLISEKIINELKFKNTDFIVNYDILEQIEMSNSIGIYINPNDNIDVAFLKKATKRLNKYLKQPKLYIFCNKNLELDINLDIEYKKISLDDYREEFYLLQKCKHKIITNSPNSRSEAFWAGIMNQKDYNYIIYDKHCKFKNLKSNWIGI